MTLTTETPAERSGRPGKKRVNWLLGRQLFLKGLTQTEIGKRLNVRREEVCRRSRAENWKLQLHEVHTSTTLKIVEKMVKSNAQILAQHDGDAELLLAVARTRLAAIKTAIEGGNVEVDSAELKDIATVVARGSAVQRASRGISTLEGFVDDEDRKIVLEIRRLAPQPRKEQIAITRDEVV